MAILAAVLPVHLTTAEDASASRSSPADAVLRPAVGAIRWDAWFGNRGSVGEAVHRSLGPGKWHDRLPFYAKVLGDDKVEIDGTPQSVIDREIEYAANAGLAYWAFVTYPPDHELSLALKRYLSSPIRTKLDFCLITECGRWHDRAFVERIVALMREPGYQHTPDGRPLLYLGFIDETGVKALGGVAGFRKVVNGLRETVAARGLPKPYIVIMDFDPRQGRKWMDILGCDAISAYAAGIENAVISYRRLADNAEQFWERCRSTGAQVVPTVMAGWDPRPRTEHPMPWGNPYGIHDGQVDRSEPATAAAIADHLGNGLRWMAEHRDAAPARTALIYAWNEFDEGGWLTPTLSEGTVRLDAIAGVLRPMSTSAPASRYAPDSPLRSAAPGR